MRPTAAFLCAIVGPTELFLCAVKRFTAPFLCVVVVVVWHRPITGARAPGRIGAPLVGPLREQKVGGTRYQRASVASHCPMKWASVSGAARHRAHVSSKP